MRNSLTSIALISVLGVSAVAKAQESVLVGIGYFRPSNGLIRDMFGSQLKFDPDFGSLKVSTDWKLKPGISMISAHKHGNKFAVIPVTAVLEKGFADEDANVIPYVKIGAGPTYNDYSFDTGGVHYAEKRISWGGSLEAGVVLSGKFRLSAKYNAFPKVDGFDFSGLTLSAQYSVYSF